MNEIQNYLDRLLRRNEGSQIWQQIVTQQHHGRLLQICTFFTCIHLQIFIAR